MPASAGLAWVRGWALWTRGRRTVTFVFIVVALGYGSAAVTVTLVPVDRDALMTFALIAAGAIVHVEATRGIERTRQGSSPGGTAPYFELRTAWNFAAILLLPPVLAIAVVLMTDAHAWLRVQPGGIRREPHRVVYTSATVLLGTQAAIGLLASAPGPYPGIPDGWAGLGLVAAAAAVRWLINYLLVVAVIIMTNPTAPRSRAYGPWNVQVLEAGAVAVAVAVAMSITHHPYLLPILVLGLVAFHQSVLLVDLRDVARTDQKTGLLNASAWLQVAEQELARARRTGGSLGVLMIDLDNFKEVNELHGHPASDQVLREVARALTDEVREYDHVGRYGGDEFVIALPGVGEHDLMTVAERLRLRVQRVPMPNGGGTTLTTSIGAAVAESATVSATVDELLRAADSACFRAKNAGRDRVCMASV